MSDSPFLRILVGATASGKERLALALAENLGAEIVSVDSMKIYRGLDVGTAKPSPADRARIRHHAIDLIGPTEEFSVARYVAAADAAIRDAAARGRPVILSGGTALYYKGLLEGLFDGPGRDPAARARWEALAMATGPGVLAAELSRRDPAAARKIHPGDTRRLVRALEIVEATGRPISALQTQWRCFHSGNGDGGEDDGGEGGEGGGPPAYRYRFAMAWLDWPRPVLLERIAMRLERMRAAGLVDEAGRVWEGRERMARTPLQAVAYKEFFPYFAGEEPESSGWERLRRGTAKLAKAQTTWFKRFPASRVPMTSATGPEDVLAAWEAASGAL